MDFGLALPTPRNDKKNKQGRGPHVRRICREALVFDVFGTVVDWRTSLINDFTKWSETQASRPTGPHWSTAGAASMPPRWMRSASIPNAAIRSWTRCTGGRWKSWSRNVDQGMTEADLQYLTMGWHRLHPWPDSVPGLTRLKKK